MTHDIQQYIFHYNPFRKQWACVDRAAYQQYMNGFASYEDVVYSDSIEFLLSMFNPTPDDSQKKES